MRRSVEKQTPAQIHQNPCKKAYPGLLLAPVELAAGTPVLAGSLTGKYIESEKVTVKEMDPGFCDVDGKDSGFELSFD